MSQLTFPPPPNNSVRNVSIKNKNMAETLIKWQIADTRARPGSHEFLPHISWVKCFCSFLTCLPSLWWWLIWHLYVDYFHGSVNFCNTTFVPVQARVCFPRLAVQLACTCAIWWKEVEMDAGPLGDMDEFPLSFGLWSPPWNNHHWLGNKRVSPSPCWW